jgi:hypothetical protein
MSLIKKPSQITARTKLRALIYGQPGIGKTTLALSSPNSLLIDADDGIGRVREDFWKDTVQVKTYADVLAVFSEDLSAYDTLVFDTAGKILDLMTAYIIKANSKHGYAGNLSIQGYGERKKLFINLISQASNIGKNVVFVAHENEEKDGDIKVVRPALSGSSLGDLIKELDVVGYMYSTGKKRMISFDACERFYGKNTIQLPPESEILPIKEGGKNDFLSLLVDRLKEQSEKRAETVKKYGELIEVIKLASESIINQETANIYVETCKGLDVIWDSNLVARSLLSDKVKELNLSYDKDSKKYV